MKTLAQTTNSVKVSRKDIAYSVSYGLNGGTTVSGTMTIAHAAGIKVFATGGIGGVHRGNTFDISADLPTLARIPMIVVCSGAKAILDIPATRENLETNGVPILGYKTNELPAFYSIKSGLEIPASQITMQIEKALEEADKNNINGASITPYLLQKVNEETKGKSMRVNIALLKNNARVAAKIAAALNSAENG